jgi:hypothetical protein
VDIIKGKRQTRQIDKHYASGKRVRKTKRKEQGLRAEASSRIKAINNKWEFKLS